MPLSMQNLTFQLMLLNTENIGDVNIWCKKIALQIYNVLYVDTFIIFI